MRLKRLLLPAMALAVASCGNSQTTGQQNSEADSSSQIKEVIGKQFYLGAALSTRVIDGTDSLGLKLALQNFNSAVAENCMKCEKIHPEIDRWDFSNSDKFIDFCQKHNLYTVGHCLIWHSQCAPWFFVDKDGNQIDKAELFRRMKDHITTEVSRYKGKVNVWDVVNEAIEDNGDYRNSKFYEIGGPEYIDSAFAWASQADPDADLIINDYNESSPQKRAKYIEIINRLKSEGIKISGVGLQTHSGLNYPDFTEYENSIKAYRDLGVDVHITELDLTVLPFPQEKVTADVSARAEYQEKFNPYKDGLPDSVSKVFNDRYMTIFRLAKKYGIKRVTVWGVYDAETWRNDWPIVGRTDYPLLFDRQGNPKQCLLDAVKEFSK